jgi:Ca2+-transporting ATPase
MTADPTEAAILEAAARDGIVRASLLAGDTVAQSHPFDAERKRSSTVVADADGRLTAYALGAPEGMAACLDPRAAHAGRQLIAAAERWAADGIRVLLVARRDGPVVAATAQSNLTPLGLLGLTDPPRSSSRESVLEARRAGVRTVMITGDHPETALAIAHDTAIVPESDTRVITGTELSQLDDRELDEQIEHVGVYARIVPQDKLRLVRALTQRGHVVAMTGDGVNDVPALRAAHIGIAMGRGTDAAAAAGDMVLTDDNYATIVHAIRRGRGIRDNIEHFLLFLLSANTGEVLLFALAVPLGLSAPLTVPQILLVNLLTDGLPAVALGVDPPQAGVMHRPPRPPRQGLLAPITRQLAAVGAAMGAAAFAAFAVGNAQSSELGQTMAFTTLVFGQLLLAFATRGRDWFFRAGANRTLFGAVVLSGAIEIMLLAVSGLAEHVGLVAMSAAQVGLALVLALVPFTVLESYKALVRARS